MKIGLIKEGKTPPDARVPLTPEQCAYIRKEFGIDIVVQPSPIRCYVDSEYRQAGIQLVDNLEDCDVLLGVKEVPVGQLIPSKTYFFFSHTIKKQPANRNLLWAILDKNIRLIDYEVLTDAQGRRLIAFGKFAGMVGAHNALWTYGQRTGLFDLPRMHTFLDYEAAKKYYQTIDWPPVKIVLTGTGRVASGAAQVLADMGIYRMSPYDFLHRKSDKAVFTQLGCKDYAARRDGSGFQLEDFYQNPHLYKSTFEKYQQSADIMINGIFWDKRAPAFFSKEDMKKDDFNIRVIADVTCDIAPDSSIPSTLRPSTITDPVYGYDPVSEAETEPYREQCIDVMAIDNLPSELPRDASGAFGEQFIQFIVPELLKSDSDVIERATIADNGVLCEPFRYLEDYVSGSSDSLIS